MSRVRDNRGMQTKRAGENTYVLRFDEGEEAAAGLLGFAREKKLGAAHFTGIGGFREATLGFFDLEQKHYDRIPVREQVEVVALVGNVSLYQGEPRVHAHVSVSRRDGTALGGHLLEGYVRPTLEVFVTELREPIARRLKERSGLPLLELP